MRPERELPPDEHLRAALRHAPDADVQAPRAIGERLLAEARRAVLPAAPPPAEPAWRRWFSTGSWLPQGALASLLIAGLVTLLWQHEEAPAPTVDARAPEATAAAAAAPARPPQPQSTAPAPARVAKSAPAPEPRAAAETTASPVVAATAPQPSPAHAADAAGAADAAKAAVAAAAPTADNPVVAESRPTTTAPAAAPAAAAPPAALQRLRAPVQAGALRASATTTPPPWQTASPVPPALEALAGRVAGPWVDAAQPAGQPLLAWQHEGTLLGRAWLDRRGDAEWLVWCATTAGTCREAPLSQEKAPPR